MAIDTNCWWRQEPPNHYCHQLYHVIFTESIDIVRKYTKPSHGRVTILRDDLDDRYIEITNTLTMAYSDNLVFMNLITSINVSCISI